MDLTNIPVELQQIWKAPGGEGLPRCGSNWFCRWRLGWDDLVEKMKVSIGGEYNRGDAVIIENRFPNLKQRKAFHISTENTTERKSYFRTGGKYVWHEQAEGR